MSDVERNLRNFERFQQEVVVRGDFTHYDELVAPGAVTLRPANIESLRLAGVEVPDGPAPMDRDAFRAAWSRAMEGRRDHRREMVQAFGSGDHGFFRWTMTWTSTAAILGVPPSGEPVTQEEVAVIRFDDRGRLLEGWYMVDPLTLLRQLGGRVVVHPPDVGAPA